MSHFQPWMLILLTASLIGMVSSVKTTETDSCKVIASGASGAKTTAGNGLGSYPVIVFHHGTFCGNHAYSTILTEIASQGFIVASPASKLNLLYFFTAEGEIRDAKQFITWLSKNIDQFMEQCMALTSVQADFDKLVGMGHSRGGRVAFGLALGLATDPVQYSAIISLDPVDHPPFQLQPSVLESKFQLSYPSLLIGSGLGPQGCAPRAFSYMAFFAKILSPAFEFVAHNDGHMDFLDAGTWQSVIGRVLCAKGSRKDAQEVATSTTVAFLKAVLLGDCDEFKHLLLGPNFVNSTGVLSSCIDSA